MPFVQTGPEVSIFYREGGAGTPVLFCGVHRDAPAGRSCGGVSMAPERRTK
jgi:hypothetical protein